MAQSAKGNPSEMRSAIVKYASLSLSWI